MIVFKKVIEIYDKSIKKIRGIAETGEYVEVRLKKVYGANKEYFLDVRVAKEEGLSMRFLYMKTVQENMSIKEIISFLDIKFLEEKDDST